MKEIQVTVNGKRFLVQNPERHGTLVRFTIQDTPYVVDVAPVAQSMQSSHTNEKRLSDTSTVVAPMPGVVIALPLQEGSSVSKGTTVAVIEAMKMENAITAPRDGTIARLHVHIGSEVQSGDTLLVIA